MAGKVGGARAGAGRKPGSATKKTREIAEQALSEGITPIEVMLNTMRRLWDAATTTDPTAIKLIESTGRSQHALALEACDIASKAAPYVHPRLQAVELTGKHGKEIATKITYEVVS